jgi:hypothetical protein
MNTVWDAHLADEPDRGEDDGDIAEDFSKFVHCLIYIYWHEPVIRYGPHE